MEILTLPQRPLIPPLPRKKPFWDMPVTAVLQQNEFRPLTPFLVKTIASLDTFPLFAGLPQLFRTAVIRQNDVAKSFPNVSIGFSNREP